MKVEMEQLEWGFSGGSCNTEEGREKDKNSKDD